MTRLIARLTIALAGTAVLATAHTGPVSAQQADLPAEVREWLARDQAQRWARMLAEGDSIFNSASCRRCHGEGGSGGSWGPDLTDSTWVQSDGSLEGIRRTIFWGVRRELMSDPAWRFEMNPGGGADLAWEQYASLAAYVWSLSNGARAREGQPEATEAEVPSPRSGFVLVYHRDIDRVVLFGGSDQSGNRLGDTWLWNGTTWGTLDGLAPPARSDAQATFDSTRGRLVLFGGSSGHGRLADTWEFDGQVWARADSGGPPARSLAAMAYDPERDRTVLFGGSGGRGVTYGDTWEWDGAQWREVSENGPTPRGAHAMAYHAGRKAVALYGGWGGDEARSDLWLWDGERWSEAPRGGAPPRLHLALAYDSVRDRLVAFGGFGVERREGDTWEWDGSVWQRASSVGPPARAEHEGTFDPQRGFVIFGGIAGQGMEVEARTKVADTWVWDGREWRRAVGAER